MITNNDIFKLQQIFITRDEFNQKLDQKFDHVMNVLDSVMGELKDIREEQTIMFHTLIGHTERLKTTKVDLSV